MSRKKMDLYFHKGTSVLVEALPAGRTPGYAVPWPFDVVKNISTNDENGEAMIAVRIPAGRVKIKNKDIFSRLEK